MVVDGQSGTEYDYIQDGPVFSPDSRRVAYLALKGKKWVAVIDGVPGPEYDPNYGSCCVGEYFIFSPDGHHVAYCAP